MELYASYGLNNREPARSDMLAGFDNLDTSNVTFVGPLDRVRPERARDLEVGARWYGPWWAVQANGFVMNFRNEILPVGRLTYIGTPLRTNVRSSWRRGLEADVAVVPSEWLEVGLTSTVMRGNIREFTDDESGMRYRDVEPLLTPRFTAAPRLVVRPGRGVTVHALGQLSGQSQLDNTGNPLLRLPAHSVGNVALAWSRGTFGLALHLNNVTNTDRFAGGHVSFGEARFYVLPPRSAFLIAKLAL